MSLVIKIFSLFTDWKQVAISRTAYSWVRKESKSPNIMKHTFRAYFCLSKFYLDKKCSVFTLMKYWLSHQHFWRCNSRKLKVTVNIYMDTKFLSTSWVDMYLERAFFPGACFTYEWPIVSNNFNNVLDKCLRPYKAA